MTYTGEVSPGGPSDVRDLPDVTIRKVSVSQMHNNCYLLTCKATGEQLLIDAADEAPRLLELVAEGGDSGLARIVTTHQHWDHHRALPELVTATAARTAAGRDDVVGMPVPTDEPLDHGDTVAFGGLGLEVIHLRGHTPGSVALVLRSSDGSTHAFTGDSLFPGGVGNTDSDAERFTALIDDVEQRLFGTLPDETWVYPGHGNDTTIGAERPAVPDWRSRGW